MRGSRRVVLWVPDWPTTSLVVDTPPGSAAAVAHRGRITVATAAARHAGVRSRMPVSTAQHLCPELVVLPHDPLREAAAFEPVAQAFDTLAAGVTCLRPGLAWAPASGPARWVGSEDALAEALVDAVAHATGAECQVGVASGVLTAVESARRGVVVAEGDTDTFLGALPLGAVRPLLPLGGAQGATETLDVLLELGVHTCGDLVHLGRGPLLTRFGGTGAFLWDLCTGADPGLPTLGRSHSVLEVSTEFDPPALDLDRMVIGLRGVAEDLASRLWGIGASSRMLTVWMVTEGGTRRERTWSGVDCADTTEVVDRLRWQLRGWTDAAASAGPGAPDSGLARVGLVARDLSTAPPGSVLWGRADADSRAARAALRVQSLLGEDAVVALHPQGGLDPRSRIRAHPWGSPLPDLVPAAGEWEGAVEGAPATLLDTPVPVELLTGPPRGGAHGSGRPGGRAGGHPGAVSRDVRSLGLVASEGELVAPVAGGAPGVGGVPGAGGAPGVGEAPVRWRPVRVGRRGALDGTPVALVPADPPRPAAPDHPATASAGEGHLATASAGEGRLAEAPPELAPELPPGLEVGVAVRVWVTGGPWPVRGRWWEGVAGCGARAYLRVGREDGPDLLLVQRAGRWAIEGIHD